MLTSLQINTWLRTIPNYQPDLARVVDIGYSFEGRDIKVIKVFRSRISNALAATHPRTHIDTHMHTHTDTHIHTHKLH